jgi:hypothetical protein
LRGFSAREETINSGKKDSKKLIRELEERAENAEVNAALHYNAQLNKEKVS